MTKVLMYLEKTSKTICSTKNAPLNNEVSSSGTHNIVDIVGIGGQHIFRVSARYEIKGIFIKHSSIARMIIQST